MHFTGGFYADLLEKRTESREGTTSDEGEEEEDRSLIAKSCAANQDGGLNFLRILPPVSLTSSETFREDAGDACHKQQTLAC